MHCIKNLLKFILHMHTSDAEDAMQQLCAWCYNLIFSTRLITRKIFIHLETLKRNFVMLLMLTIIMKLNDSFVLDT